MYSQGRRFSDQIQPPRSGSGPPGSGPGPGAGANVSAAQLPGALWNDEIYLNGVQMVVSGEGALPTFPTPGRTIAAGQGGDSFVFPAWSYGFVVFPSASAAACK